MLTTARLKDVVFGEAATNYEEGKWVKGEDNELTFLPDFDTLRAPTGDMQSFAESEEKPKYHYGDFISGSAVRTDANSIFKQIRSTVRPAVLACQC